ncbi:Sulfite exporter TauE/SafE family protein [Rhynchospora pubera]|uniref:Sulfite exporter TauE/SafE family protein n=1 Tax=Rhynchospora pubera TaxID=906938 RepID=A0AAV8CX97_9POAL|nr:Sulfite exporter TauE/SafE family protein [Rhynchospora pubera]
MKFSKTFLLKFLFLSLIHLTILSLSTSKPCNNPSSPHGQEKLSHQFFHPRNHQLSSQDDNINFNTIIAWILCFIASAASSAGGVGGGSLFLPILTIIAGLSLKSATAFSTFMVTAVTLAKVIYTLCFMDKSLINYEIALLSEPCMLLGASIGVLCNIMFPEWLITALFVLFLATSTVKTVQSGCKLWSKETEKERVKVEVEVEERESGIEVPLLEEERDVKRTGAPNLVPWKDLLVLVMVWMCFFLIHVLIGDENGKGVINIKPCGVTYWLITVSQIPIAIGFTSYILYAKRKKREQANNVNDTDTASVIKHNLESLPMYVFPVAAILTGVLSGLFGIGGGLLLNPVFLQIGVPPQTAAATSALMVSFSASMSMVQYILLGMTRINEAVMYAILCFVASIIGLVTMQRLVARSGRVSLVVFLVSGLMVLSTVVITLFGVLDVWEQITNGDYMGFKQLC